MKKIRIEQLGLIVALGAAIMVSGCSDDAAAVREEVGRLNAKVTALEGRLEQLEKLEKERSEFTQGIPSSVYNQIVTAAKEKFPDDASVQDWEIQAKVDEYKKKRGVGQ